MMVYDDVFKTMACGKIHELCKLLCNYLLTDYKRVFDRLQTPFKHVSDNLSTRCFVIIITSGQPYGVPRMTDPILAL